jgi:hypothetical protein
MTKKLFLDFDDTLAVSLFVSNEKQRDKYIEEFSEYYSYGETPIEVNEKYITFLRPITKDLIYYYQSLIGVDNVYILSWGTKEYVELACKALGININPENIYGRETMGEVPNEFKDSNNVLVDNENYSYHLFYNHVNSKKGTKVRFLNNLPMEKFVEIPDFYLYLNDADKTNIDEWTYLIDKAFEYKIENHD